MEGQGPPTGFYGPQLQTPWVISDDPVKSKNSNRNKYSFDDNSDDDEIDELKEILGMEKSRRAVPASGESDTTNAYLRSSFSGVIKKKNVLMTKSPERIARKSIEQPEKDLEFLGPQLPVDWVEEMNSRGSKFKNRFV